MVGVSALGIPGGVVWRATAVSTSLGVDAAEILTGRAAMLGIAPRDQVSAGGATRLLATADDWFALTLSRPDDIAAVPALVESNSVGPDPWPAVADWAATQPASAAVERARLLDLPAAVLGETVATGPRRANCGMPSAPRAADGLLVADLTSMWAGPLCGQLLARAGATVIKVESPSRPDGTRLGDSGFYDWVNSGKLSYAIEFDRDAEQLAQLLGAADVVLEGSRPAALERRGLGPRQVAGPPGRVWLRLSGYGTDPRAADRVAFGDDAAVAGGLVRHTADGPSFAGDAIADPLTGLEAAAVVLRSLRCGGGELIEIALADVAACYAQDAGSDSGVEPVRPTVGAPAAQLGADNAEVRRLVAARHGSSC